jgi:hypothetical protein
MDVVIERSPTTAAEPVNPKNKAASASWFYFEYQSQKLPMRLTDPGDVCLGIIISKHQ